MYAQSLCYSDLGVSIGYSYVSSVAKFKIFLVIQYIWRVGPHAHVHQIRIGHTFKEDEKSGQ